MADLSDVATYLALQAAAAVYPNGTSQPSVANMDCIVEEGWPLADKLDLDINGNMKNAAGTVVSRPGGPRAHVSIFPMQGTGKTVYQILDETYTISPPVINLSFNISGPPVTVSGGGTTINVSGQPAVGEYLTIVADEAHIYSATGPTTAALLSALATQAQVNYPAASANTTANPPTLTIPVNAYLTVRQGGQAIQGKVTHRQCNQVMVTVWAPNRVARNQFSAAIDNLIKQNIRVTMPDTSQALVIYSRTNTIDEQQAESIYRRDLIYDVEYATVFQFPAYVITSTTTSIANPSNTAIATAVT